MILRVIKHDRYKTYSIYMKINICLGNASGFPSPTPYFERPLEHTGGLLWHRVIIINEILINY